MQKIKINYKRDEMQFYLSVNGHSIISGRIKSGKVTKVMLLLNV